MAKQNLATEKVILIALLKAASEQSTFLIGEFKFEMKKDFTNLMRQADRFIEDIESRVTDDQKEFLAQITDHYHNLTKDLRSKVNEIYETT